VGNGNDYSAEVFHPGNLGSTIEHSAQVSGSISSAVGSFDSVTPATIEEMGPRVLHIPPPCQQQPCQQPDTADPCSGVTLQAANAFSLQLNSQPFPTSACQGRGDKCQGWQQFAFSQYQCDNGHPCVFIEYWLLEFGRPCPALWTPSADNGCFIDSSSMPAPAVTAAQLQGTTLTGTAAGDGDTVVLTTAAGPAMAMNTDSVLNLAQAWNTVEWNVFGDGCGFQANFPDPGSTLVVRTSVNSGTHIDCNVQICEPPLCVQEGFTGETNTLFLVGAPAVVAPSTFPAIVFTESNAADRTPASCTSTLGNIGGIDGKR